MSAQDLGIDKLPRHVAIIMDGNGRWATDRGLKRVEGHRRGSEVVKRIIDFSKDIGIEVLTLYAFSEENWHRPQEEVRALMDILANYLSSEFERMVNEGLRLHTIGRTSALPKKVQDIINAGKEVTKKNTGMVFNLALSYGSREELVRAVREIAGDVSRGDISTDDIDEDLISDHLYTNDLPDPDLLIRTSGELRISNFMLYQIAYTELFITKTLWPDFTEEEYIEILKDYSGRERRYGRTGEQVRRES